MNSLQSHIHEEFMIDIKEEPVSYNESFTTKFSSKPHKTYNKYGKYCCVKDCKSRNDDKGLSFHRFPMKGENIVWLENKFGEFEKVDRFNAWRQIVRTKHPYHRFNKICSRHFTEDDYLPQGMCKLKKYNLQAFFAINLSFSASGRPRRWLKKCAVPSLNLPITARQKAILKLREKIPYQECDAVFIKEEPLENFEPELEKFDPLRPNDKDTQMPENSITTCDQGVQVSVLTEIVGPGSVIYNIKTDHQLNTATGLESFKKLDLLVEKIKTFAKPDTCASKMSIRDKIIITYMKKKHNISFIFLHLLLCKAYSVADLEKIYKSTLEYLELAK